MCAYTVGKHFYLMHTLLTSSMIVNQLVLKENLHPTKFTMLLSAQTLYRGVHELSQVSYATLNK